MQGRAREKRTHSRRLGAIEREILTELSFGDLLLGYLASSGSVHRMYRLAHERAAYRYRRMQAIKRLEESEYIRTRGAKLSITAAGESVLEGVVAKTVRSLENKHWDGKWRIVIFDIPQNRAPLRDRVRYVLKQAGFVQLQKSAWVFPHECAELTALIQEESGLKQFILYGLLERIEGDDRLKRVFKLH